MAETREPNSIPTKEMPPETEKSAAAKPTETESTSLKQSIEAVTTVLSSENQRFFHNIPERGRDFAGQIYETLHEIPGINRIVGKLEIAYNQFWIDRHQEKAIKFKEKMDGLDLRVGAFDQSKKEIESVIENLKSQNIPGVESLQIKLQDIDRQKAGLLNEKDKTQSKFEAGDNKLKLYTNERDRVADKLIERYEEKLKPMEVELERLSTFRDQTDMLITVAEERHKKQLAKLSDIEKEKTQLEKSLRRAGTSEKEIRKLDAIKQLDKVLADGRKKVRIEKANLARRKAEINEKIAKVDAKANPYRDKREEFVRVKEGRPIKIDVAARQRGVEFKGVEETQAHSRSEAAYETGSASTEVERKSEIEEESVEDKEKLQTIVFISSWNTFLKETYNDTAKFIDAKDFLQETGLSENYRLDFKDFKNILGKYLKYRKLSVDQFNQSIDKFFEQKVKIEK
jgi:hypothetical protein